MEARSPVIVITGPTASGKTALAMTLASKFGGEIICADSRTVYRDMDIGTAKPSSVERERVPHWGLDLINPGERFTVADFKQYVEQKIVEIRARDRVPFIVGGTGLYIDALAFDYQFGGEYDIDLRESLRRLSLEDLHKYCDKHNVELPENSQNKRYVIRAIEQQGVNNKRRKTPRSDYIIVGISTNRLELRTRIEARAEHLFEHGIVEEATMLGKKYGWNSEAMTGNIYPLVKQYLNGELSESELRQKFVTSDWRLAKRQLTWLRRNQFIAWLDLKSAEQYISDILARLARS